MKLQLKRSNVIASGAAKIPTSAQLEYGELAINYNQQDPAIFLKDSNNNVIRIGGIGNIADDGQVELPTTTNPPNSPTPANGNLWYNSEDGRLYVYYVDGNSAQWVDASPDTWQSTVIPDITNTSYQAGSLDDRYNNKSGNATFVNRVDVGGLTVDSNLTPTSGTSVEHFYGTTGGVIQAFDRDNGNLEPLRVRGSTWDLGLDGSAFFNGNLTVGPYDTQPYVKGARLFPDNSGRSTLVLNGDGANGTSIGVYNGNTSSYTVRIQANGNATFAGGVESTSFFKATNNGIAYLQPNTVTAFQAYESSGPAKINLNNNGSASFGGGGFAIDADGEITTNVKSAGHIELDSTGSFSSPKIKLFSNTGAATFGGAISTSGQNTLNEASALKFSQESANLSQIRAYGSNSSTTGSLEFKVGPSTGAPLTPLTLNSNGNATFAGNMEVQKSAGTITAASSADSKFAALYAGTSANDSAVLWQNGALRFYNTTERMRIDSSGRLLLGTTTPGDGSADDLTISTTGHTGISIKSGSSSSGGIYFGDGTSGASQYEGIIQYSHAINALQFYTNYGVNSGASGMTLDSNGQLLLGTTAAGLGNAADNLTIADNGNCGMTIRSASSFVGSIYFADGTSGSANYAGFIDYQHSVDALRLGTGGGQERMRIDSAGLCLHYRNTTSTGVGLLQCNSDIGGSNRAQWYVLSNGSVENRTGAYGTIASDKRIKKDIVDAPSQWTDIKNIKMRKFRYKADGDDSQLQLGVIAQELEVVCPNLVTRKPATAEMSDESGGLIAEGEDILSWKQSIVHLKALKALQEAMERIEQLEKKVAAFEAG